MVGLEEDDHLDFLATKSVRIVRQIFDEQVKGGNATEPSYSDMSGRELIQMICINTILDLECHRDQCSTIRVCRCKRASRGD